MCKLLFVCAILLITYGCNSVDRFTILKQCTVLGDESIVYARAHYVKLFYHFNPDKFEDSYKQIKSLEAVTLKNTINTYNRAIDKLSANQSLDDKVTQQLLSSCKALSEFSTDFVDSYYKKALAHHSNKNHSSDAFFIEINQIVKFDNNIGTFDKTKTSFRQRVDNYQNAVRDYIAAYRKYIPSEFVNNRFPKKDQ